MRARRALQRTKRAAGARSGGAREVLAGLAKSDRRPALDRELEVDARGREVDEVARVVEREVVVAARAKLGELALVRRRDPARGRNPDRLEHALHAVLVLQAKR